MKRIYLPTAGATSWQALLAEPDRHWKRGASAMELAVSWELAAATERGIPHEVAEVLDQHGSTRAAQLVFGVPEHQVALPGGQRPSQTDFWAVAMAPAGLISIAGTALRYPVGVSPTVLRVKGFRLYFFSREEPRPHVHVQHAEGEAKFWIEPVVELHANYGLKPRRLAEAQRLVEEHVNEIRRAWQLHFPG